VNTIERCVLDGDSGCRCCRSFINLSPLSMGGSSTSTLGEGAVEGNRDLRKGAGQRKIFAEQTKMNMAMIIIIFVS